MANIDLDTPFKIRGASWNRVYIIESLKPDEIPTGEFLFKRMEQEHETGNWCLPSYDYVRTKAEFLNVLHRIRLDAESKEVVPFIHLEMHGLPIGLEFEGKEEFISFIELTEELRWINRACGNHMVVVLAVCYSGHLADAMNPTIHAPYYGIVANLNKPSVGAVSRFHVMYDFLYGLKNLYGAVQAMNEDIRPEERFHYYNAQAMFHQHFESHGLKEVRESMRDDEVKDAVEMYRRSPEGRWDPRSDEELFDVFTRRWYVVNDGIKQQLLDQFMGDVSDAESVAANEALGTNKALIAHYGRLMME